MVTSFYFLLHYVALLRSVLLVYFLFPRCLFLLECQTDVRTGALSTSPTRLFPELGWGHPGSLAAEVLKAGRQTDPAPELSGVQGVRRQVCPCGGWTGGGFETWSGGGEAR